MKKIGQSAMASALTQIADDGDAGGQTRRADRVDQRAARHLPDQCDQAADGEHEADIDLRP